MKFRRFVPFCLTASILLLGFESILRAAAGQYLEAAHFILFAAILDGLDGEVARLFKGVTTFGAKLDTYVDTVCFGVAPGVLAYYSVFQEYGRLGWFVSGLFLLSGVVRFAMYQVKEARVKSHSFKGLPIPVNAVWVALVTIFAQTGFFGRIEGGAEVLIQLMWACSLVFVVLQVTRIRYAKPHKEAIACGLLLVLALSVIFRNPGLGFCLSTAIGMLYFAFVSPVLAARHGLEEEEDEENLRLSH